MSVVIIGAVALLFIAIALGLYFFVFAKKDCTKITEEDECTEPCQWDTYGDKCIGEKDDLTPAPPTQPTPPGCSTYTTQDTCVSPCEWDSSMSKCGSPITPSGGGSTLSARDKKKMKCYSSRYHDVYEKYKAGGLGAVKSYYDEFGKAKNHDTSCDLKDSEALCYAAQNPEVFNAFGFDAGKAKKHYKDYGLEEVKPFSCRGGTFINSPIPKDAVIKIGAGAIQRLDTPERKYILQQQGDGNLAWNSTDEGAKWTLGSHVCGPGTTAIFQGDGNICVYGPNNCAKCTMSHDSAAKSHILVGQDDGTLYVDHGDKDTRSYIYEP